MLLFFCSSDLVPSSEVLTDRSTHLRPTGSDDTQDDTHPHTSTVHNFSAGSSVVTKNLSLLSPATVETNLVIHEVTTPETVALHGKKAKPTRLVASLTLNLPR